MALRDTSRTGFALTLLGAVALVATSRADAAAVYTFDGGNLATAGNWTFSSGTPDAGSPPPANGDIGEIAVSATFNSAIYTGGEGPPAELRILTGGSVALGSTSNLGDHNFVLDGGQITSTANNRLYGDLFIKSDSTLSAGASATAVQMQALIQDHADSTGQLTVAGSGVWRFYNPNNSYSGGTLIESNATVSLFHTGSVLGSGDVILRGTLNTSNISTAAPTSGGSIILDGGTIDLDQVHQTFQSNLVLNANSTIIGRNSGNKEFSGAITGATGTLTVKAAGSNYVWLSNSNNTHAGGTIIENGLVRANSLGTGSVTVNPDGTLEINNANAITGTQSLAVFDDGTNFGTVNLGNHNITVKTLTLGDTHFNPGDYNITGTYMGVAFGNYFNGTRSGGNTITVMALIPEPASVSLLVAGGLLMSARRRRL